MFTNTVLCCQPKRCIIVNQFSPRKSHLMLIKTVTVFPSQHQTTEAIVVFRPPRNVHISVRLNDICLNFSNSKNKCVHLKKKCVCKI